MWSSCVSFWYVSSIVFSPPAPLCAFSCARCSAFAPALAPFAFAAACVEQPHALSRLAAARRLVPRQLRYAVLAAAQPCRAVHCHAILTLPKAIALFLCRWSTHTAAPQEEALALFADAHFKQSGRCLLPVSSYGI